VKGDCRRGFVYAMAFGFVFWAVVAIVMCLVLR